MILEKGRPYNCGGFAFIPETKPFKVTCFPAYISYEFPIAIIKLQLPKHNVLSSKLQEHNYQM